jgi:nitric oxide reductase subunit C
VVRHRAPVFGSEGPPVPADFVFDYLADPQRRRDDIGASRMPDFGLDEAERTALALFLGSNPSAAGPLAEARERHPDADAALGRRIFGALGCGGCHTGVDGAEGAAAPDLSREGARVRPGWLRAFLGGPTPIRGDGHPTTRGARMPDFRLTDAEDDALAGYLQSLGSPFAQLDTAPLTAFEVRRTRRLLEDRLACLGCHRLGGEGGRIGPALDGIAGRLEPSFVLEMILDPSRAAPGSPMPRQPMQPREARRLARYLLQAGGATPAPPPPRRSLADPANPEWALPADPASRGEELYARHCSACHGATGHADGWNAPNLPVAPAAHADAARMSKRADDTLFDGIYAGAWVLDGSPRMPAFGRMLSTEDIRALVAYIRTLCSCQGPPWSRDGRGGGPP